MINRSLIELVKGRIREFCREPSALIFVVCMPVIWICVLGLALSDTQEKPVFVGLINQNDSRHGFYENIRHALGEYPNRIKVKEVAQEEGYTQLKRGNIWLLVVPDTDKDSIDYVYDPELSEGSRAFQTVNDVIQSSFGRTDPVKTQTRSLEVPGARYVDFLIPGLLIFSLFTTSMFGTGMTIVSNRRENLLKRYLATPMNPYSYILSHIIGRIFIFAIEVFVVLLTGMAIFGFRIQGSLPLFLTCALISTACFTSIAVLLAARNSNTATYNGTINFLTLPMMIFAGVWFSRDHLPEWINMVASYLPLTLGVDCARLIALESANWVAVAPTLLLLLAYTAIFTCIAKIRFRWYT
ncbi:MAG: ABC transporter permease [Zetaproteobacteria bacterium]|nr:ABC transporter permease [Zetaproteobacteria bacterium]